VGGSRRAKHVGAVPNAHDDRFVRCRQLGAKGGAKPTSEDVKNGMEAIKDFTLGGMVPPITVTPQDHEGGGWVQVWSVQGGKLVKSTEWFQGYPDVIKKHLAAVN